MGALGNDNVAVTRHATERIVKRGITRGMIDAAIAGKRYYLPDRRAWKCIARIGGAKICAVIMDADSRTILTAYIDNLTDGGNDDSDREESYYRHGKKCHFEQKKKIKRNKQKLANIERCDRYAERY